jgi:anti-anti-sigma factor
MSDLGTELTIDGDDDGRLVLTGEIDADSAPRLERAILDRFEQGSTSVRLDLSGVTFMDSSGLRVVIATTEAARGRGGDLVLAEPTSAVRRLIEVSGLEDHLNIDS